MLKTLSHASVRSSAAQGTRLLQTHLCTVHTDTATSPHTSSSLPPHLLHPREETDSTETPETRAPLSKYRHYNFHPSNTPDSPEFGTNQHISIDEELKLKLKSVVAQFNAPIRYAFAYGSGVFQQKGYDLKKQPTVDFIFGVSHPEHWHALNMQQNPHHYSSVRLLGSHAIGLLQEKVGAGVYFNPYVQMNGMMIKYGVVSIDTLCSDLIDWDTLYLAGRMHKPVKILRDDPRVRLANQVNLTEAVRVALLTMPEKFSDQALFERIAGISYVGDFRMIIGENPNKVQNIVHAQMEAFHRLYRGLLDDLPNLTVLGNDQYQQNQNPRFRGLMVQKLPKTLYEKVLYLHRHETSQSNAILAHDKIELYQQIAASPNIGSYIDRALRDTISHTAITQSLKGIATAGPLRTSRYMKEKLSKWWSAKQ
ncbi:mitochondrial matrix Mmp37-domain-containing protein [Spinellus fusiger]|nr:mitochondrial matrix Mmp37-domain-containing protein [Spinellus fusiger]